MWLHSPLKCLTFRFVDLFSTELNAKVAAQTWNSPTQLQTRHPNAKLSAKTGNSPRPKANLHPLLPLPNIDSRKLYSPPQLETRCPNKLETRLAQQPIFTLATACSRNSIIATVNSPPQVETRRHNSELAAPTRNSLPKLETRRDQQPISTLASATSRNLITESETVRQTCELAAPTWNSYHNWILA